MDYSEYFSRENTIVVLVLLAGVLAGLTGYEVTERLPYIPVEEQSGDLISWMNENLVPVFDFISFVINSLLNPVKGVLTRTPPLLVILVFAALGLKVKDWRLSVFTVAGFLFISMVGYWQETMVTMSLVLVATIISLLAGIPLGVLKAYSDIMSTLLNPVLDFMQTMPMFVYLIPAVFFFGIGNVPGIVATFIFSMPPAVRLTSLGIEQIPEEISEAGEAFGASRIQFLSKIQLPLAMPSIMMGVNQTIMLALSMVVIGSMIGARGLGEAVLRGISRLRVGVGITAGLAIVLIAMMLDRITKGISDN